MIYSGLTLRDKYCCKRGNNGIRTRNRGYTKWMDPGINFDKPWTIFGQFGVYFIISCILNVVSPQCNDWQIGIRF